jgi:hypothetical protein
MPPHSTIAKTSAGMLKPAKVAAARPVVPKRHPVCALMLTA